MRNKKILYAIIFGAIAIILIYNSLFLAASPKPFLQEEALISEINQFAPNAEAEVIQDKILIDETHRFVPFINKEDDYGMSFWVWKMRDWRLESVHTRGEPHIWKINRHEPAAYVLVWNIDPKDQVSSIEFYQIQDRNAGRTDGADYYRPRVQMEYSAAIKDKTYNAVPMPEEWVVYTEHAMKIKTPQMNSFINRFFSDSPMFIAWLPKDSSGKETFPKHTVNGTNHSSGKEIIDFVRIINASELEN
jgi:hypothetical protein